MSDSPAVDTRLTQLNIPEDLRANSSFMKVLATLFHYGNQSMNAVQLVVAVRTLNLLALRGETPKSTIQGIISTSRKLARDLGLSDPFRIDRGGAGRQTQYAISDEIMNGVEPPPTIDIPDEPIVLRPVEHPYPSTKRSRKTTSFYTPSNNYKHNKRKSKKSKKSFEDMQDSDIDIGADEDFDFSGYVFGGEEETTTNQEAAEEEDTTVDYTLLYSPPTIDIDYIDKINFKEYPIAAHFAIVQQKGYSYPRFRSHEKIKIPKRNCEDKFRVTDIRKENHIVGRLFVLADGHGGPGCSEFFVRKIPAAVEALCQKYDPVTLTNSQMQNSMKTEIKAMIQRLDEEYLSKKREELERKKENEHIDNDGCTLILNIFLDEWLINVNVGDSRTILISAPEPTSGKPDLVETGGLLGMDVEYKMDVVFASQDHKPYLEHLAREILENGGEFIDSVQNRVIKVDVDKLKEDGNRHTKRLALKNARIRPKGHNTIQDQSINAVTVDHVEDSSQENSLPADSVNGWAAQSTVRTTAIQPPNSPPSSKSHRIPSLNVARSCGDLDFKMDPQHKIISCEPDVIFIRIKDQPFGEHTLLLNGPHKEKRRHFLFMSTDGTFDYMYEETAERQNRAIAKVIGPMIEDGEKIGKYLLEEEEMAQDETIGYIKEEPVKEEIEKEKMSKGESNLQNTFAENKYESTTIKENHDLRDYTKKELEKDEKVKEGVHIETDDKNAAVESAKENRNVDSSEIKDEGINAEQKEPKETEEELPRIPLLYCELTEEEYRARKIKERTLVYTARYFANREGAQGIFASTLQDYDDCTFATTVWIPILAIEGKFRLMGSWRRRIPHLWAYLLLGELVGISCASSLFFAVMLSHPPLRKRVPSKLLITLALSVITGLISVMVSPNIAVYSKRLILNLLTIHIILYLPLLFDFSESSEFTVYNGTPKVVALIYSLTAGANISIYLQEWAKCLLTLDQSKCMLCDIYSTLFTTFFEHPAQTTIGSDVIFVNMAGIAWMWSHSQLVWKKHIPNWAWLCMFTTPILSASVTLPIFFAACEGTKLIVDQKKHE
ncbi:hypothetical protein G6F33_002520 [Rhizopus arrhizus]|nr:hypothetical protein G6F24_001741 [Rhizopus arrhizus]KAG0916316.1 hypothetical protein G6F33_002520 [Rhizopus arrhizus]